MIKGAAQRVFRCFRRFERFVDRLTGRAGPLFVALASILIVICAFTFFEVIFPSTFLQPSTPRLFGLLALLFCAYMCSGIIIHYRLACLTSPGSPLDPIAVLEPPPPAPPAPVTLTGDQGVWNRLVACLPGRATGSKRSERGRAEAIRAVKASQSQNQTASNGAAHQRKPSGDRKRVTEEERVEMETRERRSEARMCKKCPAVGIFGPDGRSGPPKPERAHHCRICGRCWLKFDHHCPWINQCIGLGNERYFLLFMVYLSISCLLIVWWGWTPLRRSWDWDYDWTYVSPRTFVLLTWVMTLAMGVTVGIMAAWQLVQIVRGETSVESSDNEYYRQVMKSRGQAFVNPYDLGRHRNLAYFFNVRPFSRRGWLSVLVPIRVPPASDGWSWEKRQGWERRVVMYAEELTDEEEDDDN